MTLPLTLATLVAMAAATYLTRVGGYLAINKISITPRINQTLEATTAAALVAIIAPAAADGDTGASLALVVAVVVMLLTRNRYSQSQSAQSPPASPDDRHPLPDRKLDHQSPWPQSLIGRPAFRSIFQRRSSTRSRVCGQDFPQTGENQIPHRRDALGKQKADAELMELTDKEFSDKPGSTNDMYGNQVAPEMDIVR